MARPGQRQRQRKHRRRQLSLPLPPQVDTAAIFDAGALSGSTCPAVCLPGISNFDQTSPPPYTSSIDGTRPTFPIGFSWHHPLPTLSPTSDGAPRSDKDMVTPASPPPTPENSAPLHSPATAPREDTPDMAQSTAEPEADPLADPGQPTATVLKAHGRCLLSINGSLLPGYANDSIRRLGRGLAPGVITEIAFAAGDLTMPVLTLSIRARDRHAEQSLITITSPIQHFNEPADVSILDATNETLMTSLFSYPTVDMAQLQGPTRPRGYDDPFLGATEPIPHQIQRVASDIIRIQFSIDRSHFISKMAIEFFGDLDRQHPDLVRLARQVADHVIVNQRDTLCVTAYIDYDNKPPLLHAWQSLSTIRTTDHPFQPYLIHTRSGASDLTYNNINMEDLPHLERPHPPVTSFLNHDHRTVALMAGAVEELAYQDFMADTGRKTLFDMAFCLDATELWTPDPPQDLRTYGLLGDGSPRYLYAITDVGTMAHLLPAIGDPVSLYPTIAASNRPQPLGLPFGPREADDATATLRMAFDKYAADGDQARQVAQGRLQALEERGAPPSAIATQQALVDREPEYTTTRGRTSHIFAMIADPSPLIVQRFPDMNREDQRWQTAFHTAHALRQHDDENDIPYLARLRTWVQRNGLVFPAHVPAELGDPYPGKRISLPHGCTANKALFRVRVPSCTNWHPNLRSPPVITNLPLAEHMASLRHLLGTGFDTAPKVPTRPWWTPRDTTITTECSAITKANALPEGDRRQWWQYATSLHQYRGRMRDLTVSFPHLRTLLADASLSDEQRAILRNLSRTRAGVAIIVGCPGAGKSTLSSILVRAALHAPVAAGWLPAEDGCLTAMELSSPLTAMAESRPSTHAAFPTITPMDEAAAEQRVLAADHDHAVVPSRRDREIVARLRRDRQQDGPDNAARDALVDDDAVDSAWDRHDSTTGSPIADGWPMQQPMDDQPENPHLALAPVPRIATPIPTLDNPIRQPYRTATTADTPPRCGRVVWIAPSNQLCRDACNRLNSLTTANRLIRLYPIDAETSNVLHLAPEEPRLPEGVDGLSRVDRELAVHRHQLRLDNHLTTSPAADPYSLSETAKRLARQSPRYAAFIADLALRQTHPDEFASRLVDLRAAGKRLMEDVVRQASIFVATPVAIAQAVNYTGLQADLIVVDEAGRMTETQAIIPIAFLPDAACIYVGDPRQFGPVQPIFADGTFSTVFARQRAQSLIHRAFQAGAIDGILTTNFRCHGHIAAYVKTYHYGKTMHIHFKHHQLTDQIRTWMGTLHHGRQEDQHPSNDANSSPTLPPPSLTNCLWLNTYEATEHGVGTSFANVTQARLAVAVAIQFLQEGPASNVDDFLRNEASPRLGSVMILCPYASQRALYHGELAKIPASIAPPGLITVRTVDDSQSHEATFVILDLVRSTSHGFLNDRARLVVATTRAKLGMVIIGNGDIIPRSGPLFQMWQWFQTFDAVAKMGRKFRLDKWCDRCQWFGHESGACTVVIRCANCHGPHAGITCPTDRRQRSVAFHDGPLPMDDFPRHIQVAADDPKQQKRKKINAARRAQYNRAPTTRSLLARQRDERCATTGMMTIDEELGDAVVAQTAAVDESSTRPCPTPEPSIAAAIQQSLEDHDAIIAEQMALADLSTTDHALNTAQEQPSPQPSDNTADDDPSQHQTDDETPDTPDWSLHQTSVSAYDDIQW
ncbi:hypothetical protein XA68_10713 [Ophiocordyceps unilateralis]|uniref:DNA2/NAM7 helicase-like C-terminal domain-containing protein n=1 Tax=Ophiocordyceps unilateralis TaxID=268505 RepID=A0A2A9PQK5_OPHUN|nr:hypothetical protein XA68_10713 [Ophiocordyceps unilateralis]